LWEEKIAKTPNPMLGGHGDLAIHASQSARLPLVDGIPAARGSILTASRSARAKDLKQTSTM
jgi:hypothetical protein